MLNPLSVLKHPVLLCLYFISSLAHAQNFSSAATNAVGGAGRAAVEAGDVNYLNPAGLVHLKVRYVYSTFSKDDLSLSLSDSSKDVLVPASFSYFQSKTLDAANREIKWQDTRLSLGGFLTNKISMGLTGIMSTGKINDVGYNQNNANIGFFYTPTDHFGLGYVLYNVFGADEMVPELLRFTPEMAVGMNFVYQNFIRFRFDVKSANHNNFGNPTYMTGFETLVNEWFAFRLGYQHDILARQELFTGGIGFNGPTFSVNYAHMGSIKGAFFDRHSIDLLISF